MKEFFYKVFKHSSFFNISNIKQFGVPATVPNGHLSLFTIQLIHVRVFFLVHQKEEGFYFFKAIKLEQSCPWPENGYIIQNALDLEARYNQESNFESIRDIVIQEAKGKTSENTSTMSTFQERAIFFVTIILALLGVFYSTNLKEIISVIEKSSLTPIDLLLIVASTLLLLQVVNASFFSYMVLRNKTRTRSTIQDLITGTRTLLFNSLIDLVATRKEKEYISNCIIIAQNNIRCGVYLIIITSVFLAIKDIKIEKPDMKNKIYASKTIQFDFNKNFEDSESKKQFLTALVSFKEVKSIYLVHNLSDEKVIHSHKNALTTLSERSLMKEVSIDQRFIEKKFILVKIEGKI